MAASTIQRFLRWLTADTTYLRTCMFIVGACICFGLCWAVLREWPIQEVFVWFIVLLFSAFGLALILIPLFAQDKKFERYIELMADGGDIPAVLFFIAVMFAAIPLTVVIRMAKRAMK